MSDPVKRQQSTGSLSHNLVGQRLGRKGAETRERAVTAMLRLLEAPDGPPVTLTSVAREASVGMTTLYLYFPDLGDLLLAALRRVVSSSGEAISARLRTRWPDETLALSCLEFLQAHLEYWRRHARLLQMRNSFADAFDVRVLDFRYEVSTPLLDLFVFQMDGLLGDREDFRLHLASVLLIMLERVATVVTNPQFFITSRSHGVTNEQSYIDRMIEAEARLLEMAICNQRAASKASHAM